MTQATLPGARAALTDANGVTKPEFYRFFAALERAQSGNATAAEIAALQTQIAAIQAEIDALPSEKGYPILRALAPLISDGLLQNGYAQLRWAGTTSDVPEGTNLYYTNARVDAEMATQSINVLADVDTTTTPPANGQALVFNGTLWVPGSSGGVPSGGTTGQIIVKQSATDGDVAWKDKTNIAVTNDVANYASLPTTLGSGDAGQYWLTRDSGMAYRWSGTAWPASGAGVQVGLPAYQETTLTSSQPSVTFSGLLGSAYTLDFTVPQLATINAGIWINGDFASANYASQQIVGIASSFYASRSTSNNSYAISCGTNGITSGRASIVQTGNGVLIAVQKSRADGAAVPYAYGLSTTTWTGTGQITSITVKDPSANIAAGSYFRVTKVR